MTLATSDTVAHTSMTPTEDPGGLGILHYHHVAVGLVDLHGHTQVVARLVFVSHFERSLHGSLLLASPIPPQLQRVVGVEAPGS
jgi:hypothetical protein